MTLTCVINRVIIIIIIRHVNGTWALMKRFSGSEVKGQGHSEVKNIKDAKMLTDSEKMRDVFIDNVCTAVLKSRSVLFVLICDLNQN